MLPVPRLVSRHRLTTQSYMAPAAAGGGRHVMTTDRAPSAARRRRASATSAPPEVRSVDRSYHRITSVLRRHRSTAACQTDARTKRILLSQAVANDNIPLC